MSFRTGDTFLTKLSHLDVDDHLWAIISDTEQSLDKVVIVNFTTWRDDFVTQDGSCILDAGDHPFIRRKTYVSYRDAKIVSVAFFEDTEKKNCLVRHKTLEKRVLAKVRQGALTSRMNLPLDAREVLEDQNLM